MNLIRTTTAAISARARHTRRGTFIVLVVGMLALMTIIAVVYFSIGQADARSSAALVSANSRNDVPNAVRDYIKQIIADDVTGVVDPGTTALDRTQRVLREAWDYPFTSPLARSIDTLPANRFTPVGTRGDDPWLASSEPSILWTGTIAASGPSSRENMHLYRRDWQHISNIAPDGNYINLYNIRPQGDGWEATPIEMRQNLTLFTENGDPGATVLDNGQPVDDLIPAHFSYRQRNAFRPAYDDLPFSDPDYLLYSWTDTDGDGFVDARWQELVNASNASVAPTYPFTSNDGLRYFVATRIIDISGRVNVNTATDFVNAPSSDSPVGMTPADIDLRSLFTQQDAFTLYAATYGGGIGTHGTGAYNIWNPTEPDSVENYRDMDNVTAYEVGASGYNAARLFRESSVVPPPRTNLDAFAAKYLGDGATGDRIMPSGLEREKSYLAAGSGASGASLTNVGLAFSGGFGISDLAELLSYNSINDPEQISLLESAVGGRLLTSADTRRYSPFRDNRTLAYERPGATLLPADTAKLNTSMLASAIDIRQRMTTMSGARPIRPAPTNAALLQTNSANSTYDFSSNIRSLIFARNVGRIFRGYADALAPFSNIAGAWDRSGGGDFTQSRFLSYGYDGPELAVRSAAHAAVNLMAATGFDGTADTEDFEPYPYTLILNEGARAELNADNSLPVSGRTFAQAWWDTIERQLDLSSARIAPTGVAMPTHAVTMFGVKPQPVITQATAYTLYIDAPSVLGGDNDVGSSDGGVPPVIEVIPITINGTTSWTNSDYLGRILAIQLTNPYDDIDIPLTRDDILTDGASLSPTELLFTYYFEFGDKTYKLAQLDETDPASPQKAIVLKRGETRNFVILDADYATFNSRWNEVATRYSGPLDSSAESPFRKWLNAQLSVENTTGTINPVIIPHFNAATGAQEPAGEIFAGTEAQHRSVRLWRAMISGATDDNLTVASGANSIENDYLVDRMRDSALAGATLRRELPSGDNDVGGTIGGEERFSGPPSALNDNTGYTIALRASIRRPDEGENGDTGVPAYMIESKSNSKNRRQNDTFTPASVNKGDFAANNNGGYQRFTTFLTGTSETVPPADVLMTTARQRADVKTGGAIGTNLSSASYASIVPELPLSLRNRLLNGTLRPADMLLPFAIGPFVEMDESGNAVIDDFSAATDRFYTLGEALALALDYDRGPAGSTIADLGNPARTLAFSPARAALTRANLIYDDYVLFRDVDTNGTYTYGVATTDIVYGTGIPAALSLLDIFHTMDEGFRSERVATPGLININTAPVEVLRAARLLSPFDGVAADWWFTPATQHNGTSDIASTLVAFRDKVPVYPRRAGAYDATVLLDFTDGNDGDPGNLELAGDDNGRYFATGIPGLRETPGFRSLGELMLARDIRLSNPDRDLHSIDRLGFDSASLSAPGVDATKSTLADDLIPDDYSEGLAIANGVANLFTVRSDYYAVWFVIHGYAQSDVVGLKPDEPLVPSVARRFLMIVDRSNVTIRGDEPQVVLFKELPY
jgi:hypothetical protein